MATLKVVCNECKKLVERIQISSN